MAGEINTEPNTDTNTGSHDLRPRAHRTRAAVTRAVASVIAAGALTLFAASGAHATTQQSPDAAAATMGSVSAVGTSTDDFSFDSFAADYRLGRDRDEHATLTTTETLVAEFPQTDQNHGIRRSIPTTQDGHPTDLHIQSVTDGAGHARSFTTDTDSDDGDFLVVTIAAKHYVHGAQTYVIRYSQKNVIHYPDNAKDDEFYRDVNGTGWAQQFGTVTGSLHVPASLAPTLTGQTACYQGTYGSSTPCDDIQTTSNGSGKVVTAHGNRLGPRANVTMVVGFRSGTFAPRDSSFFASPAALPMIGVTILALLALIGAVVTRRTLWRNAPGRPTIIAEYQPPKNVDVLLAARLVKADGRVSMVAGILDLAVRGILRMLHTEGKGFRRDEFSVELMRDSDLTSADRSLAHAVFGDIAVGVRQDLSTRSAELGKRITTLLAAVPARATAEGFQRSTKGRRRTVLTIVGIVAAVGSVVTCVAMTGEDYGGAWPIALTLLAIAFGIATVILASTARPLTALGAETRDHLAGLKLYIELAEADRMRVLQSPEGALRTSTPLSDEQVLQLNERLLPYAVLFKRDKEWMRVIGDAYEAAGTSPSWYSGSGAFNTALLVSSISSFSASSSTWAGSASSSSGSGFGGGGFGGGGGFSGGGGGGGGGGGV